MIGEGVDCLCGLLPLPEPSEDVGVEGAEVIPDNVDDFAVWGGNVIELIVFHRSDNLSLRMNKYAYAQLLKWWYEQKGIEKPESFNSFAGAAIIIDNRISSRQETVI